MINTDFQRVTAASLRHPSDPTDPTDFPETINPFKPLIYPKTYPASVIPVFWRPGPFVPPQRKKDRYPDWEDCEGYDRPFQCCMSPLRYSFFSTLSENRLVLTWERQFPHWHTSRQRRCFFCRTLARRKNLRQIMGGESPEACCRNQVTIFSRPSCAICQWGHWRSHDMLILRRKGFRAMNSFEKKERIIWRNTAEHPTAFRGRQSPALREAPDVRWLRKGNNTDNCRTDEERAVPLFRREWHSGH